MTSNLLGPILMHTAKRLYQKIQIKASVEVANSESHLVSRQAFSRNRALYSKRYNKARTPRNLITVTTLIYLVSCWRLI